MFDQFCSSRDAQKQDRNTREACHFVCWNKPDDKSQPKQLAAILITWDSEFRTTHHDIGIYHRTFNFGEYLDFDEDPNRIYNSNGAYDYDEETVMFTIRDERYQIDEKDYRFYFAYKYGDENE